MCVCVCVCNIHIYIYIDMYNLYAHVDKRICLTYVHANTRAMRSISEISSCFFGPRPWHIEIRHRVNKTSTINLLGSETLKLKTRRLKLWKPTVRSGGGCGPAGERRAARAAVGARPPQVGGCILDYLVLSGSGLQVV